MSDPGHRWAAVLATMERRLDLAERQLAGEEVHLDHFVLPDGLGPLPPEHRDRAAALLDATRRMEHRVAAEMDTTADRIRRAPRSRLQPVRPTAVYVDRSA